MAKTKTDNYEQVFGLFLRPTGKGLATRYAATSAGFTTIGAAGTKDDGRTRVDTAIVVAIPIAEAHRFRREYKRQVREGAVKDVGVEGYRAFIKASHAAEKKAQKAAADAAPPKDDGKPNPKE